MRAAFVVTSLIPLAALAGPDHAPVIGGQNAPAGKWPDLAGVYQKINGSSDQECTGTLIAPTVVITAGHCNDPASSIDRVLIGTNSLGHPELGEYINVTKTFEYPASQSSYDVSVLLLEKASKFAPRMVATGWASVEIKNGVQVHVAGYGSIDKDGNVYVDELKEATTTITDFDCSIHKTDGCEPQLIPTGELGAGGMGTDTCPGDSGGPLYLDTDYGTVLAGVTSRGYDSNVDYCGEGGIYVKPQDLANWIEEQTGVEITRAPEPDVPKMLTAVRGHAADAMIDANDPKSDKHHFEITQQGMYATAAVKDDGRLRVCMNDGVVAKDSIKLKITDANDDTRSLLYTIPIDITDGDPGDKCDPNSFASEGSGCCDAGGAAGGSIPLALGVGALLVRRRRRRRRRA